MKQFKVLFKNSHFMQKRLEGNMSRCQKWMLMRGGVMGSSAVALHFSAFSKCSAMSIYYIDNQFFFSFFEFIFLYSRFLLVIYFIHVSVYMSIPISQFIPPLPAFPPWCPYICSLHLCLYFCLANRFICTIYR